MYYKIQTIHKKSEITNCPLFYIDKYNWGGDYRPITYGKMAYMKEKGFFIHMTCEEENPLTTYCKEEEPVYEDSAMEAFIEFDPINKASTYVNIEVNANGAMLNRYGQKPPDRKHYKEFTKGECTCKTLIHKDSWEVEIYISKEYVKDLFNKSFFIPGDKIRCNFYKICGKNSPYRHYGSYTIIESPIPNFHLPEYFAHAVIVE